MNEYQDSTERVTKQRLKVHYRPGLKVPEKNRKRQNNTRGNNNGKKGAKTLAKKEDRGKGG